MIEEFRERSELAGRAKGMANKIIKLPEAGDSIGIKRRHMEEMGVKVAPEIVERDLGETLFVDMINKRQAEIDAPKPDSKGENKNYPGQPGLNFPASHDNRNISEDNQRFKAGLGYFF